MSFLFALMTSCVFAGAALAGDSEYQNPDVVKLPAPPGENVLLYPGGQYGRIIPNGLKQPGTDLAPVHLHRPYHHAPAWQQKPQVTVRPLPAPVMAKSAPAPIVKKPATKPVVKPAIKPVVKHVAKATPAPAAALKSHKAHKTHKTKPQKVVHVARQEAPKRHIRPRNVPHAGLLKGRIAFLQSASQPVGAEIGRINALARDLDGEIGGRRRVQILAYAGPKGHKTSSARRLSLKRALIVRQLLIDGGVPSEKIDVRAMGGVTDNGAPDRVDVFLKN